MELSEPPAAFPLTKQIAVADPVDWPLNGASSTTEEKREKRQSLRLRPSQYLQNAEPPSPLRDMSQPPLPPIGAAKMSLFNLFSRPKVEKQRGYTERGQEVPPSPPPSSKDLKKSASTPSLLMVPTVDASASTTQPPSPSPDATARTNSAPRIKFKEQAKPPREPKNGPFEPPPLFQAYPQSTKDGTLELSPISVEAATHKYKGKRSGLADENASVHTKQSRVTLKYGGENHLELSRKIFVLITSGYVLQYASTGPSNRLPEKILHLGKDSAAFASDLLPGRHHVLQVCHAVGKDGALVHGSGSLLSKFGIRSAAAKRMTSSFLLVMQSASEMDSWMTAIKRAIEDSGGKKYEPDPIRPSTRDAAAGLAALKKSPSHRYQIKRNPSKVDRLEPADPLLPKIDDGDASEIATIDGIEMEASKLEDAKETSTRPRALSDVPSLSSSAAVSVEQNQLNGIRNSESNSTRTSNTSHAGTITSPGGTSQASSVAGSPPSERILNEASKESVDAQAAPKSFFRPIASYSSSWRRSGVPLAMQKAGTIPPALNLSPSKPKFTTIVESPDANTVSHSPIRASPPKNLIATRSEPNLNSAVQAKAHPESKSPPSVPAVPEIPKTIPAVNRVDSVLTNSSTWSAGQVPTRRTSLQPSAIRSTPRTPPSGTTEPRNKRMSFSMPLKVNPSGVHAQAATTVPSRRRTSQMYEPDVAGETPTVHTLSAKVEPSNRRSVQAEPALSPWQMSEAAQPIAANRPRSRLSLLAEQPLHPLGTNTPMMPTRASPVPSPTNLPQAQPSQRALRRPTSLQVNSDPAPFLTYARSNGTATPTDARAIPIRGMKPSRSASNVAALATAHSTEATRHLTSSTPTLTEEADDQAMPLPERALSPTPARPGSRTGSRRGLKTRSSLPELDFGIPVVGLGPPAPPPNAPLPAPPPGGSRSPSPNPAMMSIGRAVSPTPSSAGQPEMGAMDVMAGLGIRVS